jgi:hypothetical protein
VKLLFVLLALCFVACNLRHTDAAAVARTNVKQPSEARNSDEKAQAPLPTITPTPELNMAFGKGMRIVPKEIKLENQRLRYKIDVVYPQVEGTKIPRILRLNQRVKCLISDHYRWPLYPLKEDMRYYYKHPDAFNTVNLTYSVPLATDKLLSIYLEGYSYGIGAAHSVQYSLAVNYDLKSGKFLKLADIIKPNLNHLRFVSQYCMNDLAKRYGNSLFKDALEPKAKNYESWNITTEGITINFDACNVLGCAGGKQEVVLPFVTLKDVLNPNSAVSLLAK